MSTLHAVELGVLGPLQARRDGAPVTIPGAKPRAILTMLGLHGSSIVSAETLLELLWGDDPPRTAAKALQTHISALRRTLDDGFVLTEGTGWVLAKSETDALRYKLATKRGRDAAAAGDSIQAVARFDEALTLWRGIPDLPDTRRGVSEKTRWIEGHAALVEDRADALLATGRAAEIIGELEAAVSDAPLRERRWGQLMLALYRAGRQGEALAAFQRARSLLADELGVDPGPELRRLESAIVAQDASLEVPVGQHLSTVTRAVTFLLTDIEGSTAAWEADADAMAIALARHDELAEQVVTSRGGRLIKTRGEGDATFSVFDRPSAAAAAALELQEAIAREPWALREPMRIRIALHTGEAELRDGDYFGRAVNRAARLRSLAVGGQILCSGATAELAIDSLPDDVLFADLGMRQLKNLARPEHVFELRLQATEDGPAEQMADAPLERPALPAVLIGPGPFVGRTHELEGLVSVWETALTGGMHAVLIAGEPGVGKTRLAGEWSQRAYQQGAVVLYGRCDEDLGAPYQPFAEALRSLVPCIGARRLRGLRGVEALLSLVPGLTDVLPDLAAPTRADPDTERYALFDAVVALLEVACASAPVVVVLDDLHWAAKPTLLLLRHLLRFGDQTRVQIVGTYRSTDLDRSHPLAAMLADLHRSSDSGTANRLQLSGLDEGDVTAYVTEAGYDDEELARALASVTGGNPFFLIEALRHVDESGGVWDPTTLPQGVRETVSRRLSRLSAETNKALAAAAVVGSRFAVDLVERVVDQDLVDAFDEARQAGIVIEEPGGHYRFNHAIVRQSLLAELASVRRMRLHQRIAATLETQANADDELLAELAHHYFECAWAGNAAKAVEYCRRAADQAMARLGYEGAADLYDRALHALEEIDEELPDRDDRTAELLVARCEALLAAGDVASAARAVSQLRAATVASARLAAWATCFDGQLSMLTHPERLDEIEAALDAAAEKLAGLDDAAGEATAHTVRAACLARLGRIADCEIALDEALTAARRAREHRRVNAVLAGAPLAALWGPNPVPRAGGRCLDVVRLLRITTDSPAVEATSTRCQAILEAFRGRGAAARRMIDSARRTVTDLGLRHALLEVEQFAGIVELVIDDPAAAEQRLRKAYNGFRRMGLDADTAETAALLGRACLLLDRDAEAGELCTESERLAGHALKPSIAWRTLRAQLLSRGSHHDEARRVAEAAVSLAERTDALVDHGDACLALATVLAAAGDVSGARTAAERAVGLWERKGAAALVEKARLVLDDRVVPTVQTGPAPPDAPVVELDTACVRVGQRVIAAIHSGAWDVFKELYAPEAFVESRRKIVGFKQIDLPSGDWVRQSKRAVEDAGLRFNQVFIAVRGERLALAQVVTGSADVSPGAPRDEFLSLLGLDDGGRIALQIWFDIEDIDAAIAELDATYGRLDQQQSQARRLENAATRLNDRVSELFVDGCWDKIGALFADNLWLDDRRRGLRRESNDPATEVANLREVAASGIVRISERAIALRGDRLVLSDVTFHGRNGFGAETLAITEIDTNGLIVTMIAFDLDDFEAAIAELDARYLAGEAAPYAHTWSVIATSFASASRHELPAMTPNCVTIDHRRAAAFAPGKGGAYFHASWELATELNVYIEAVHRLSDLGAIFTHVGNGTSRDGFQAEWRTVDINTVEGDLISRGELFDESDLHAALARFEQLSRPAPRLENAASQAYERIGACMARRDWDAMAQDFAENYHLDDRRRVANAEAYQGRDTAIEDLRVSADIGLVYTMFGVTATRGQRLALVRGRASGPDLGAVQHDARCLVEIEAEGRVAGVIVFDPDDLEAAIAELDALYIAGEGAAYARTWSVITQVYAAHNRREIAAATPDVVSLDHRRGPAFAPGEGIEYIRAGWDLDQTLKIYIETAHQVNDLGAVFTWAGYGTSHEGFDAEWRGVNLMTVDGELLSRAEVFDEEDLETALAKFDQLSRPTPQLTNAASQVAERFWSCFATRDWNAIAEVLAVNVRVEDRRRPTNAGIRYGRDAEIEDLQAAAHVGFTNLTPAVIATRGGRLFLSRTQATGHDPEAIRVEVLHLIEIDADERIAAIVLFELDDFDAALEELDARYLAGEAAAHADTWSALARTCALFNQHELPATTPDSVYVDHRPVLTVEAADLLTYLRGVWDQTADARIYIETVHRLSNDAAVVTHAVKGTSPEGFNAEWRMIDILAVEGNRLSRCEVFEEADLEAAITRFEQLSRPAPRLDELHSRSPRLENAANRVLERVFTCFAARDWIALAELVAEDIRSEDRRPVVNAGIRHGRVAELADMRAIADVGVRQVTVIAVATRAEHLTLCRVLLPVEKQGPESFRTEALCLVEINADNQVAARLLFDVDDMGAAFEELETRYLAGEASAHAHTWSVIAGTYAAFNRHDLTEADWAVVDHRRGALFVSSNMINSVRAFWDQTPDLGIRILAVHRIRNFGAVVTHAAHGTSPEGFDAEWRMIQLLTLRGDRIGGCELFDEADLDAALARFDELQPQPRQVENAASQVEQRISTYFVARDWDAMAGLITDDICFDDRRRCVNAGAYHGRDAEIASLRALADVGVTNMTATVIAIRGARLVLSHYAVWDDWSGSGTSKAMVVAEINAENQVVARVIFDADDFDAAIAELEARYIAGEAAVHAHTWSVVAATSAGVNRRELPATTSDSVYIDHRPLVSVEGVDLAASLRAMWDITSAFSVYVEAVHRLDELGVVVTQMLKAATREGVDAELRFIEMVTIEGELCSRVECFDEADLDTALARFDELHPQAPRLENAASQVFERFMTRWVARDWGAVAEMLAVDVFNDDRRRVVNAGIRQGRDATIASMRASADFGLSSVTSTVIATRGERLALSRDCFSIRDEQSEAVIAEVLGIVGIDADERIVTRLALDLDDFEAAIAELDARYVAGEAAADADTWSVIAGIQAAVNRRELPATTPNPGYIDHRPLVSIEGADLAASIRAVFELFSAYRVYVEAVHRLDELGAVYTQVHRGTSNDGVDAEFRMIEVQTIEGGLLSRAEVFDEADLDVALARFAELHPKAPHLENAASRTYVRMWKHFIVRDWATLAETLADDIVDEDQRLVVGHGIRRGRDAELENLRVTAGLGITHVTPTVVAARGERLALIRVSLSGRDPQPGAFYSEVLRVIGTNAEERIELAVMFNLDDIGAAFEELDARYVAGEAAPHARTWTAMTRVQAAYNRHEFLPTTDDWVNIDHRRGRAFAPDDMIAYTRATYDVAPNVKGHLEAVHRLSSLGAVVTEVVTGTSREGFDFELREIALFTFDGDIICRFEMFDEADLGAALARFDELDRPAPLLENAATRARARIADAMNLRDVKGLLALITADACYDDRRRGLRDEGLAARPELVRGILEAPRGWRLEVAPLAIRGSRLALARGKYRDTKEADRPITTEHLMLTELNADGLVRNSVIFDPDDVDAAFEELDARYLAGEAAPHVHTWLVIANGYAALNRHEIPKTTSDFVNIDHRRGRGFEPGDMIPYMHATFDVASDIKGRVEVVHRLGGLGAVVTHAFYGTSEQGFNAEWREIAVLTVDGDRVNRGEMFDEVDLGAALARFDELDRQVPQLENASTRTWCLLVDAYNRRDMSGFLALMTEDTQLDDRRKGLRAKLNGLAVWKNVQHLFQAASSWRLSMEPIAIRGSHLSLTRHCVRDIDETDQPITWEALCVMEVDEHNLMGEQVIFDPDNLDAALEELDAQYLGGEAAGHSRTWAVIAHAYVALSRGELPATTPDCVNIDHRRGIAFGGDVIPYVRATWDVTPDFKTHIEVVHRLTDIGALVTWASYGSSQDGFDAEWRGITLSTLEGDQINRCEMFDETDLDAALARFDELDRPPTTQS